MKVVFLSDVEGTAQVGEVKEVRKGFARNYLLPRGLAAPAKEPYLGWAEKRAVREAKNQTELDAQATAAAARMEGMRITIPARVGETGRLYGSVTSVHIAAEVAKLLGEELFDHRKVLLPEAIKEIGVQPVRLRLTRNVEAAIEVEVFAEGEEPGMEAAAEAESAGDEPAAEAEEASGEDQVKEGTGGSEEEGA
jgi:large subunit ribosomal protein L9